MAIARNSAADLGNNGGSTNNLTVAYTVGSGLNRMVVCGVECGTTGNTNPTVQYNSVSLTSGVVESPATWGLSLWYGLNPASGSHNFAITSSGTDFITALAADYTGVAQTGQPDNTGTGQDSAPNNTFSHSYSTIADNCAIIGFFAGDGGTPSVAAPFSLAASQTGVQGTSNTVGLAEDILVHPAGSVSLASTLTVTTDVQSQLVMSIKPFIPIIEAKTGSRRFAIKPKRTKRVRGRQLLPQPIIQPAHVIMKAPIERSRLVWPRRKIKFNRPFAHHLTYPFPFVPPPARYNQGIAFRQTLSFVVDVQHFDYGAFSSVPNYPALTKQGNTVGFTTSYPTITGQNQNAAQDARLAGNIFNNF